MNESRLFFDIDYSALEMRALAHCIGTLQHTYPYGGTAMKKNIVTILNSSRPLLGSLKVADYFKFPNGSNVYVVNYRSNDCRTPLEYIQLANGARWSTASCVSIGKDTEVIRCKPVDLRFEMVK